LTIIPIQGVIQVFSSQVEVSVQILSGSGSNCPSGHNSGSCVLAVTGVSPSTVDAGGWPKVALDYSSNTQITGAYFAIWNQYGDMVYLQSFTFSYSDSWGFIYGESLAIGLGGGSNAQFTS